MKKIFKRVVVFALAASLFSYPVIAEKETDNMQSINTLTNLLSGNINSQNDKNVVEFNFSKALEVRKNIEKSFEEGNNATEKNTQLAVKAAEKKENKSEVKEKTSENNNNLNKSNKEEVKKQEAVQMSSKQDTVVKTEDTRKSGSDTFGMTSDEYKLFVAIVDVEASGDSYQEKLGVANVILNRIKYGWGGSVSEIVYQPGQFPPAHNGVLAARLQNGPWSSDSEKAVREALSGNNNIETAQSFNMYFGQTESGKTLIMGNTLFYNYK